MSSEKRFLISLRGHTRHDRIWLNVPCDNCAGADYGSRADGAAPLPAPVEEVLIIRPEPIFGAPVRAVVLCHSPHGMIARIYPHV